MPRNEARWQLPEGVLEHLEQSDVEIEEESKVLRQRPPASRAGEAPHPDA
jgi:hypothetical protein